MTTSPEHIPLVVRLQIAVIRIGQRLARWGAAIVWPIEWFFMNTVGRVFAATERVEGVESLFIWIGFLLTWPIRTIWRLVAAVFSVLPLPVQAVLAAPWRFLNYLRFAVVDGFMWLAERLNLDVVVFYFLKWTKPVWYPFAAVLGFLFAWVSTREFRQIVWGLPAIIAVLPLAALGSWTMIRGNGGVAEQYLVAIREAREKKDYQHVALLERKLAQLGVATELADFQTALALAQDDKWDDAYERMKRLAPADEPRYVPAHYWLVQQLLRGTLKLPDEERHRLTNIHLGHLQTLGVKGPQFDFLRAISLQADNKLAEAGALLDPLARRFPEAAMMRMDINLRLQQMDEAQQDARYIRTHMEDATRHKETLTSQQYAAWTIAENLLGNLPKAHSLAEQWYQLTPSDKFARQYLLELDLRSFDAMLAVSAPNVDRMTTLLRRAIKLSVDPKLLQPGLVSLYKRKQDYPAVQKIVDQVADSTDTPAAILETLGTVAATMGESQQATIYLKRAVERDPENAVAWNNYAWILSQEPSGGLDEALAAVNKALAISPNEFRFRETRGQILVNMQRWKEAIDDLEFASNGMPDSSNVHQSLAKAYAALGESQLADVHRAQAAQHSGGQ